MDCCKEPIRVLQIVPNMQAGGLENLIMNLYRNVDRSKVQFDFLVHYAKPNFFDDEIVKLGGHIHYLTLRDDGNFFKYIWSLRKLFLKNKYTIVHSHMASLAFVHLGMAKLCGVKTRIVHSHNSSSSKTLKGRVKAVLLKLAPIFANEHFACSQSAGRFLYGETPFHVVNNAIDLGRFVFSPQKRNEICAELGIDEKTTVVGHIGRFNVQKNHLFLLDVFAECLKRKKMMKLVLVGDGELKQTVSARIKELGLGNDVIQTGVRRDVESFYSVFDVFVMPSLFEGLPVTGVEAQAAGLPCIFSTEVTREIALLPTTHFCSLKVSARKWSKQIIEMLKLKRMYDTMNYLDLYDIKKEARNLQAWYINHS